MPPAAPPKIPANKVPATGTFRLRAVAAPYIAVVDIAVTSTHSGSVSTIFFSKEEVALIWCDSNPHTNIQEILTNSSLIRRKLITARIRSITTQAVIRRYLFLTHHLGVVG
jgi:hypothetical protein